MEIMHELISSSYSTRVVAVVPALQDEHYIRVGDGHDINKNGMHTSWFGKPDTGISIFLSNISNW